MNTTLTASSLGIERRPLAELDGSWKAAARINLAAVVPMTLLMWSRSGSAAWPLVPHFALVVLLLTNLNYLALLLLMRGLARLPRLPWVLHYLFHGLLLLPLFAVLDVVIDQPLLALVGPDLARFHWYIGFGVLLTVLYALEVRTIERFQQRQDVARAREHELESARRSAEATAFQAQLKPHFVFNALNTIAALVHDDPVQAERATLGLARLMRQILEIRDGVLVSLASEVAVARAYLEIERARMGPRLEYSLDVPGELLQVPVPAMVLQPLVENAVQHGVRQRSDGGRVRVRVTSDGARTLIEVADDGPGFSSHHGAGHGTRLVEERLDRIYDGQATLQLMRDAAQKQTVAVLSIPRTPDGARA